MGDRSVGHEQAALAAYGIAQSVLNLLFAITSLLQPSETNRVVFLGQSWQRLASSALPLIALAGSLALLVRLRRPAHAAAAVRRLREDWHTPALAAALLMILCAGAVLIPSAMGGAAAIAGYIRGLLPLAAWSLLSGIGLAAVTLVIGESGRRQALAFTLMAAVCALGMALHVRIWPQNEDRNDDIYFTYLEGDRLLRGENPYVRVLDGDMRENAKYATYLPLFYYLSAATQRLGFAEYPQWAGLWRVVFLVAASWIAACIAAQGRHSRLQLLALTGGLFWLFNRWTLHVVISADLDFLPLAALLTAWALLPRRPRGALIVLGISLAIKHYAAVLVPLALMQRWTTSAELKSRWWKDLLLIAAVPLVVSLPFLIPNAQALVKSILFSISRDPMASGDIFSLDALLGWTGATARLPMVGVVALIYAAALRGRLGLYASSLLVLATVTFFNAVFFTSYMVWVVPFIPLAVTEVVTHRPHDEGLGPTAVGKTAS